MLRRWRCRSHGKSAADQLRETAPNAILAPIATPGGSRRSLRWPVQRCGLHGAARVDRIRTRDSDAQRKDPRPAWRRAGRPSRRRRSATRPPRLRRTKQFFHPVRRPPHPEVVPPASNPASIRTAKSKIISLSACISIASRRLPDRMEHSIGRGIGDARACSRDSLQTKATPGNGPSKKSSAISKAALPSRFPPRRYRISATCSSLRRSRRLRSRSRTSGAVSGSRRDARPPHRGAASCARPRPPRIRRSLPEPFTSHDLASCCSLEWRPQAVAVFDMLKESLAHLPDEVVEPAGLVLGRRTRNSGPLPPPAAGIHATVSASASTAIIISARCCGSRPISSCSISRASRRVRWPSGARKDAVDGCRRHAALFQLRRLRHMIELDMRATPRTWSGWRPGPACGSAPAPPNFCALIAKPPREAAFLPAHPEDFRHLLVVCSHAQGAV